MGAPYSARIIEDVGMTLKALEIFYLVNGAAVKGWKKVEGEGESVSWVGARTKGKGRECKLTKNMFLHSDLLKLCLKKYTTSLTSSLTQPCFMIRKLVLRGNRVKI